MIPIKAIESLGIKTDGIVEVFRQVHYIDVTETGFDCFIGKEILNLYEDRPITDGLYLFSVKNMQWDARRIRKRIGYRYVHTAVLLIAKDDKFEEFVKVEDNAMWWVFMWPKAIWWLRKHPTYEALWTERKAIAREWHNVNEKLKRKRTEKYRRQGS